MIVYLLVSALSFFAVSRILPGFKIKSFGTAVVCAIVMALVGIVVKILSPLLVLPILAVLLPAAVLGPLGLMLAIFVVATFVQTVILVITDKLIDDFEIDSWTTAFIASILMAIVSAVLTRILH